MSPFDGPARWSGPGKRSVQAKPTGKRGAKEDSPVEAPETGTEVTLDEPAEEKAAADEGSTKTGG